jgi:hypothetical protein
VGGLLLHKNCPPGTFPSSKCCIKIKKESLKLILLTK